MSLTDSGLITLPYGADRCFSCEIDSRRVAFSRPAPAADGDFGRKLRAALEQPLDFPRLAQAVISDDHVALALDRDTPQAAGILAEIWLVLERQGIAAENVLVIQPASANGCAAVDPRTALPEDVRHRIRWQLHDPADRAACAYLATTSSGERVYLARDVIDADVAISIGHVGYDPILGYRGTNSVFYPGLSSADAQARTCGQGHSELAPEDVRPVRQLIDEVAWLLGTQFSIQVVPSAGDGVASVVAGNADTVYAEGRRRLDEAWRVQLDDRVDIAVLAVDQDAAGHGWRQIGAALATAQNVVRRGGKVIVLSELTEQPGPGLELLRDCEQPNDAIRPLRQQSAPDLIPATQLARAVNWADVYLLSRLDGDLVEGLFMVPLEKEREITKLLAGEECCVFIGSAQNTFGEVIAST